MSPSFGLIPVREATLLTLFCSMFSVLIFAYPLYHFCVPLKLAPRGPKTQVCGEQLQYGATTLVYA
jgi:hypothetical protein